MDYDDNDFQSKNLHLAGEGSNKFPPALQPYALPKFDFDDSLHGHLRFDSLVETEVFLGIESNEDNQWIEDFSRCSSGIQFSASAAGPCSISRHSNVWSEATSSESVEMLLKSVGQEEVIPVQNNSKLSDACDELGCIMKQMEPSLKQDNTPSKVGDVADLQPILPSNETEENFPILDADVGQQQFLVEDSSETQKSDTSAAEGLGDLTAINLPVGLAVNEDSSFINSNSNVNQREVDTLVNEPLNNMTEIGCASEMQVDSVGSLQNIRTGTNELNSENAINETGDDNMDVFGANDGEIQGEPHVLSEEPLMGDKMVHSSMVKSGGSHLDNPFCSATLETVEEANTNESNPSSVGEPSFVMSKGDSILSEKLNIGERLGIDVPRISVMGIEGSSPFERHEVETSNGSQLDNKDTVCKLEASLSSMDDNKVNEDKIDGSSNNCADDNSTSTANKTQVEGIQKCCQDLLGKGNTHKESLSDCGKVDLCCTGDRGSSSLGQGTTEKEMAGSKLKSDATAGGESVDGVPGPSGNGTTRDAIVDHNDVKTPPFTKVGFSKLDKEENVVANTSTKASVSDLKTSSQLTTGADHISEYEKGLSPLVAGQMPMQSADQSLLTIDSCNAESCSEPLVEVNKVNKDGAEDTVVCPVPSELTANKEDAAEAITKDNEKAVLEATVNNKNMAVSDSSAMESQSNTSQKGQGNNGAVIASEDKSSMQIDVQITNECGSSSADVSKPVGESLSVIRATDLSQNESDKQDADQNDSIAGVPSGDASKVSSVSQDSHQNDASNVVRSFTFQVGPVADSPKIEPYKKGQPISIIQSSKVSSIVDGSPSTSGLGQVNSKIAQDLTRESPKVSDAATVHSGSKATAARKPRRASGRATGKESAKKGNPNRENTPARLERGEKMTNASLRPAGISQLVQPNEMQLFAHVDSGSIKPFVLATSTSSLPDLNSSASPTLLFQQPFTDLQQVQLRAQIFAYGALIQGTAPDEAYMISAFGGHDGGRSIWEKAWRTCLERLHSQKSHLLTPETPLQSHLGDRAPEQAIKQSAVQSKVIPSPVGRASSKATPSTIVNPIVPLSSPLWSNPTPSADTLQSSVVPRGPVVDYQRGHSPLHSHQTPPMRNFVGHNPSWISQAPFLGPWVASPQTSALDTSGRFSMQLPVTETVKLTPVKESYVPQSSGHVAQSVISASAVAGTSVPDAKKVAISSGQPSGETKSRKKKKASVSENLGQNVIHPPHQTASFPAPVIASHLSTSVASSVGLVSKAPEKLITSASPISSTNVGKGDQNTQHRAILSEETLGKLKDARLQAEDAAALAAAAVSHGEELWNQLGKQRNSGSSSEIVIKLASASVAIAAAAAVAKAAAAAANIASNAALQAKLMAEEAVFPSSYVHPSQSNAISASDGIKNLGKATPASILKGDDGTNSSSSILVAAREAARKRIEAASAASKRAENMDAIVKAAELAAEAVSQAGKIVAMGDPLPLSELVAAGPEGYWKVAHVTSEMVSRSNDVDKTLNMGGIGEGLDTFTRHSHDNPSGNKEAHITNHVKSPTRRETSIGDQVRSVDGAFGSGAAGTRDGKGQKDQKASDLARTISTIPESQNGPRSSITGQKDSEKMTSIKEGSLVEVFKDESGFKVAWYSANVLSLKDGKAYVSFTELASSEAGSDKLKEWVALEGEDDKAPRIRIARPITAMPFEGTRKRRRAAAGDYTWSVGDRVDAWLHDSWWEGIITEKSKKDETMITVHFPVQGETSVVRAWHLRASLMWKDGEWVEWPSSRENDCSSHGGDTPPEKRPRVMKSAAVEAKSMDKTSKSTDAMESDKPKEPTLLDLAASEKIFNIGKSIRDNNKPDGLRMTWTGLQKEGSRVIFGVPKPGKKRKFMEVSKHYVGDRSGKNNEVNETVKFTKYLIPQGSGSRGWKNTSKTEPQEKRVAVSKPRVLKSGKPQNISTRTIPQKDNTVPASGDGNVSDHTLKTKDSASNVENASGKQNVMNFQSFSSTEGAAEVPVLSTSLAVASETFSKKMSSSTAKPERANKGKLPPVAGKLEKIEEDKVSNGNTAKSTTDVEQPRRSNRRIQPTSRLLEGLQSSLMVAKFPSISHDKSHKSRAALRGNKHG